MIKRDHSELSISQQCKLVRLSRSAFYYTPVGVDEGTLAMTKEIDRGIHQVSVLREPPNCRLLAPTRNGDWPPWRQAADGEDGTGGNLQAPSDQPAATSASSLSVLAEKDADRPLESGLERRHHLCSNAERVLYLVAIMDWATHKALSWRLSNTMHADFCVDALNEAIVKHGSPEIMNTDQGSQFTGLAWITMLIEAGVRISMDGHGRYLANIFIERLWRSLKQEAIYLEDIADGFQVSRVVKDWMAFYKTEDPIPRLIGERRMRHIEPAWKSKKQHET